MSNTFTLYTSGVVHFGGDVRRPAGHFRWSDLDPFTQGYLEALFASLRDALGDESGPNRSIFRFSDLAPETLARILKDCAEWPEDRARALYLGVGDGKRFWRTRNEGKWLDEGFPPLTPYLGDDGRVYLKED